MEAMKKEVVLLQVRSQHKEFASEGKGLMEEKKEEKVPCYKSGIHAHLERPIAERSSSMEKKEEESPFKEVPLLRL